MLVDALKKKFGLTLKSWAYWKRFLQAKMLANESLKDYAITLRRYYLEWLEKAGYEQTFEGILEHMAKDRFFDSQEPSLKVNVLSGDAHGLPEKKDGNKHEKKKFVKHNDFKRENKLSLAKTIVIKQRK